MSEHISHDELNEAGAQLEEAATQLGMSKSLAAHAALYFYAACVVTNEVTDDQAIDILKQMLTMIREDTKAPNGGLLS